MGTCSSVHTADHAKPLVDSTFERHLPTTTEGVVVPTVTHEIQTSRRREIFNELAVGTGGVDSKLKKRNAGHESEVRFVLKRVLPWLKSQRDPQIIGELWAVLGFDVYPLPARTDDALERLNEFFAGLDHDSTGLVKFQHFNRQISRAQSYREDEEGDPFAGGAQAAMSRNTVVGVDVSSLLDSTRIVIVHIKEVLSSRQH